MGEEDAPAERDSEGVGAAEAENDAVPHWVLLTDCDDVGAPLAVAQGDAPEEALLAAEVEAEGLEPKEAEADAQAVALLLARADAEEDTLPVSHTLRVALTRALPDWETLVEKVGVSVALCVPLPQPEVLWVAVTLRLYVPQGEVLPEKEAEAVPDREREEVAQAELEMVGEGVAPCEAEVLELPEKEGLPENTADPVMLAVEANDVEGKRELEDECVLHTEAVPETQLEKDCVAQRDCETETVRDAAGEPEREADALAVNEANEGVACALGDAPARIEDDTL